MRRLQCQGRDYIPNFMHHYHGPSNRNAQNLEQVSSCTSNKLVQSMFLLIPYSCGQPPRNLARFIVVLFHYKTILLLV
jgi:hypothetical protein